MAGISEWFRVFKLLLYKDFLVRKRHWKSAVILQTVLPFLLFVMCLAIRDLGIEQPPTFIDHDTYYRILDKDGLIDGYSTGYKLFYTPKNPEIDALMRATQKCLGISSSSLRGFESEADLLTGYFKAQANQTNPFSNSVHAVVFNNVGKNGLPKSLDYKIRPSMELPLSLFTSLETGFQMPTLYMTLAPFVQIQYCLDQNFINAVARPKPPFNFTMSLQKMPYPPHEENREFNNAILSMFAMFAVFAFLMPVSVENKFHAKEKEIGVNVLMSMNGVPTYMNLLSWLVSGLMCALVYVTIMILGFKFMFHTKVPPFLNYGSVIIVWVLLMLHVAHLITFGMHIAAYFARPTFMTIAYIFAYYGAFALHGNLLKKKIYAPIPYLGVIFPNLLLYRTFEEFPTYEEKLIGVQFSNLFTPSSGNYGFLGSTGCIFLLGLLGTTIHFLAAIYVHAIRPGKYGVGREPLYFLKRSKSNKVSYDLELSECDYSNDNNGRRFETVTKGVLRSGIQIRDLKKVYVTNVFNKSYIHALKGVSIDIYKGQITALLGHNGAGKTTLMSILTGVISSTEGTVIINGQNVKDDLDEVRMNLGLCPQENMMFPDLTPLEQVRLFGLLKAKNKSRNKIEEDSHTLLRKLNLMDKKNSVPKTLSGGQKRRLCLAMALIGDADTLILDEPTSGMDPENRRDTWDMLLKMRGQKTIIISTHDMEEADILGDRIAIVHTGRLRSYGTALFLKRLYGHGRLEVTLSTDVGSDQDLLKEQFPPETQIVGAEEGKIIFSVPNSENLPDTLDAIESKKKTLGVSGISVSLITLEQVFLKATAEDEDVTDEVKAFSAAPKKLRGMALINQQNAALFEKKLLFTRKNFCTTLLIMILPLIPIFLMALNNNIIKEDLTVHPIDQSLYSNAESFYRADNVDLGNFYKSSVEDAKGVATAVTGESLSKGLLKVGRESLARYRNYLITAAEFNKSDSGSMIYANGMWAEAAIISMPISMNLITNALAKTLAGPEYDIRVSYQKLPQTIEFGTILDTGNFFDSLVRIFVLSSFFFPTVALFAIQPVQEVLTSMKHLQRMNGVSSFSYWGITYVADLILYAAMTMLVLLGFMISDMVLGVKLYYAKELGIMFLLFILFGINVIPITYIFSFMKKSIQSTLTILSIIPIALVFGQFLLDFVTLVVEKLKWAHPIQQKGLMLVPYISFFNAQLEFYVVGLKNSRCRRLEEYILKATCDGILQDPCCELECHNGICNTTFPYFNGWKETDDLDKRNYSLNLYVLYLCFTPLIYFGILALLESRILMKYITRRKSVGRLIPDMDKEEKVKKEKWIVAREVSKKKHGSQIGEMNGVSFADEHNVPSQERSQPDYLQPETDNSLYLVYELSKTFGNLRAVREVNFRVKPGECFGLLGVNGAGKSTTFKMLTGEEIPTTGTMYLRNYNSNDNKLNYLSEMGYCPQTDAMLQSMNSYDHLRLMGKMRGIPGHLIDAEVDKWINRLNLNAHAAQPCGTYSGGNKRRLNMAMALIGGPSLVLLDEPTTGVDPAARRLLWTILKNCQAGGQSIILTSHSMEECEVLCNRLVIMVKGQLLCIGPSEELKQRFGAGYDILIKLNPEHQQEEVENMKRYIESSLQCELRDENLGFLGYHITNPNTTWKNMYETMNTLKSRHQCIEDFSVLSATLEQLFIKFARAADANQSTSTVVNVEPISV